MGRAVAYVPEQFKIEIYSKIHEGMIYFGLRADTRRWLALLLKDFEHHGMIGDFNDAKLLTVKGIEDFFLAESPAQKEPGSRKLAGVHT